MSVLNFLLKNLQGCCLLFNYQGSFSLLSSQRQLIYIIIIIVACQQLFYFSFLLSFRSSLPFETAYLEYHFCRHLSTGIFFFFQSFFNLFRSCFSTEPRRKTGIHLRLTRGSQLSPVSSHATACLIYHGAFKLSILFLLFILFAQFLQFHLEHSALLIHFL